MQANLEKQRAAYHASKPLDAQVKATERRLQDAKDKLFAHKAKAATLEDAAEKAKKALDEHMAATPKLEEKVAKAREEWETVRCKALEEGPIADEHADPMASLPASWRAVIAQSPQREDLVGQFKQARKEQIDKEKKEQEEADNTNTSEGKGTGKGKGSRRNDSTDIDSCVFDEFQSEDFVKELLAVSPGEGVGDAAHIDAVRKRLQAKCAAVVEESKRRKTG